MGGATSRTHVLWLVPTFMAVHNAEEAIFFPRYLPLVLARLPEAWRSVVGPITLGQVWSALFAVTLIPVVLAAWATLRPERAAPIWLLLLIQATLLVNVFWHISAAIVLFNGYAPGLATAVLLNLPFSVYLIRRAVEQNWVSQRARWALLPSAFVVHGPALFGLLWLTERL
jgi:Protein of unknown function with HXXEE motif